MPQILLAGKDWTARALLRAQLIEQGLEVKAFDQMKDVSKRLWASKQMPALLVADLSLSENPALDVAELSQWSKLLPVWILAAHSTVSPEELEGRGFERIIFRPISLGQLADEIKERVGQE